MFLFCLFALMSAERAGTSFPNFLFVPHKQELQTLKSLSHYSDFASSLTVQRHMSVCLSIYLILSCSLKPHSYPADVHISMFKSVVCPKSFVICFSGQRSERELVYTLNPRQRQVSLVQTARATQRNPISPLLPPLPSSPKSMSMKTVLELDQGECWGLLTMIVLLEFAPVYCRASCLWLSSGVHLNG